MSTASSEVTQTSPRPLKPVPHGDERCADPRSPVLLRLGHTCQDTWRWAAGASAIPSSDSFLPFATRPCQREGWGKRG